VSESYVGDLFGFPSLSFIVFDTLDGDKTNVQEITIQKVEAFGAEDIVPIHYMLIFWLVHFGVTSFCSQ